MLWSRARRTMVAVAWVVMYFLILVGPTWAQGAGSGSGDNGTHLVPEIEPGLAWSGLMLLAGGMLLVADRRRRKR
jgi:LPXTG-motif cell wall-anchored protein